jgi:hypothetical protein
LRVRDESPAKECEKGQGEKCAEKSAASKRHNTSPKIAAMRGGKARHSRGVIDALG